MRQLLPLFFLIGSLQSVLSQNISFNKRYDSLLRVKQSIKIDTSKINIWNELASLHKFIRPDSSIYYASNALERSRSIAFYKGELHALNHLGVAYSTLGNDASAVKINLEGLKRAEQMGSKDDQSFFLVNLADNYQSTANYEKALSYYLKAYSLFKLLDNFRFSAVCGSYIGQTYFILGKVDSAFVYCYRGKNQGIALNVEWVIRQTHARLGEIHRDLGQLDSALYYFKRANRKTASVGEGTGDSYRALEIAKLFKSVQQHDSCLYYADKALQIGVRNKLYFDIANASIFIAEFYEKSDAAKAIHFNKMALAYKDSLMKLSKMASFTDMVDFDEQQRNFELETANREFQSKIRMNIFIGSTFTLMIIAFFLYRNNRNKQKAKKKIEDAYDQLKSTQSQLIQSEKMASLGELTAGIAHEIQNPLNFVNNFSEVSNELIKEIQDIRHKTQDQSGKSEEDDLLKDIADNLEKINHHGKRAADIVKGMLQHSRTSSGQKEPTDINALCDEYLRLSYHGLRAKDKTFNAKFETDFDISLPKINVVPQDIGRVVLNLINNAFYAVNEKLKAQSSKLIAEGEKYEPTVSVITKRMGDKVLISVKDNGNGIPQKILDKIFQPFFTTKPTGQGTGLGLSLSYDIVKAHLGELSVRTPSERVESKKEKGSEFVIELPIV